MLFYHGSSTVAHWICRLCIVFLAFDVLFVVFCIALAFVIGIAVCCCLPCIIAILYAVAEEVQITSCLFFHFPPCIIASDKTFVSSVLWCHVSCFLPQCSQISPPASLCRPLFCWMSESWFKCSCKWKSKSLSAWMVTDSGGRVISKSLCWWFKSKSMGLMISACAGTSLVSILQNSSHLWWQRSWIISQMSFMQSRSTGGTCV